MIVCIEWLLVVYSPTASKHSLGKHPVLADHTTRAGRSCGLDASALQVEALRNGQNQIMASSPTDLRKFFAQILGAPVSDNFQ